MSPKLNILIVEDNPHKVKNISDTINSIKKNVDHYVVVANDLVSAREHLHSISFDLLILDLILPERPGDDPKKDSGIEFIKEITRSLRLKKPKHLIGLSAFQEAIDISDKEFQNELWYLIKYDEANSSWRDQIVNKIEYLSDCKIESCNNTKNQYEYDFGIITALHNPEFRALKSLDIDWASIKVPGDSTEYLRGEKTINGKRIKFIAATAYQMGMVAATALSIKIISNFKPRFLIMAGIAAGIRHESKLGDILIADQSWDYNCGKMSVDNKGGDSFLPEPKVLPLDVNIIECIATVVSNRKYLEEVQNEWPLDSKGDRLNAHIGPIVSGSSVIGNSELVSGIRKQNRKIIGIDMETYGVFYASRNCIEPRPIPISIKSVCDFADSEKNDNYQSYASFTSARYIYKLIVNELIEFL